MKNDWKSCLWTKTQKKRDLEKADKIIETVCVFYEITPEELKSGSRKPYLVFPRHVAMYLAVSNGVTCKQIAKKLNRERSAVTHAVKSVLDQVEVYEEARLEVIGLAGKLNIDLKKNQEI